MDDPEGDAEPCDFCTHPYSSHDDADVTNGCGDCKAQGEPRSTWQHQFEPEE